MTLPQDDLSNLNPRTDREWLMKLNWRFDQVEQSQADNLDTILAVLDEVKSGAASREVRIRKLEDCNIATNEDLKTLKESSKKWDITNSLGVLIVLITTILAALGVTGS